MLAAAPSAPAAVAEGNELRIAAQALADVLPKEPRSLGDYFAREQLLALRAALATPTPQSPAAVAGVAPCPADLVDDAMRAHLGPKYCPASGKPDDSFLSPVAVYDAASAQAEQQVSFPERDASKTNAEQGLYRKFEVRRVDGSDAPGGKHHDCEYFVLDMTHDRYAKAALRTYAQLCHATHPQLAYELDKRYDLMHAQAEQHRALSEEQREAVTYAISTLAATQIDNAQLHRRIRALKALLATLDGGKHE
jgi:hypothetical protein